ncbi:helix-turn-helix transcriptional regulator, partial [Rhizorhapis sp. SPR117]|uniref:helix-turn-helix transcriptional regulator n=1 Tax=Rhizorhapis sp. SPR117 TaxID=2912611 RepID=UPI001F2B8B54|nr:helix-turn-helix transcriptional regulator [Rhizorhapis sp. SPR117]
WFKHGSNLSENLCRYRVTSQRQSTLSFLHRATGAAHYTAFQFGDAAPRRILGLSLDGSDTSIRQSTLYTSGGFWREDPMIIEARSGPSLCQTTLLRMDINKLPSGEFRDVLYGRVNICERLMICGGSPDRKLGLSILRPAGEGCLPGRELRRLSRVASALLSLVAKHDRITCHVGGAATTLTSLVEIERSIASSPEALSRREAQVCARILYGVSGIGIALDLGISEQTVMTYRKRAYARLGIGCQRELLLWYLALWQPCEPAAVTH